MTMVNTIVAFDIDGTLTEPEVREKFRELNRKEDVTVGVLTANPPFAAHNFIKKHELEPDFTRSAIIKARPMVGMNLSFLTENRVYVGNTRSDRMFTRLSAWGFVDANDISTL